MKKWVVENKFRIQNSEFRIKDLIKVLLENRGVKTKKEVEEFLNPKLENVTAQKVGIDKKQLQTAIKRITKAIKEQEQIVVFGDYDVDGICGTAILWETLNSLGAKVLPYIPHRTEEGYGLSIKSLNNVISNLFRNPVSSEMPKQVRHDRKGLIITVDNGIVANEPVEFAKEQGIDVIITDHHLPSKQLPKAHAIVHTTKVCGAGVAWLLSQEIRNSKFEIRNKLKIKNQKLKEEINHLELVALATVADMVPLIGPNRTLVKFGLEKLKQTKRPGLLELFKEAVIDQSSIGVYEIGHIIAPRLNASGRIEHAMDSLRLICTKDKERAKDLAFKLGSTNRERQQVTIETVEHAKTGIKNKELGVKNLLFVVDESYQPGVIGLVAGKLVDEFYRPTIVISKGEKFSKASARSVRGFNIIEFIREASEFLVDCGGHPMAAGFTIETEKIILLQEKLEALAEKLIDGDKLTRSLRIDCEMPLLMINSDLYDEIQNLSPFGIGNPEPTFVSKNVVVEDIRIVGRDSKHLKFIFGCHAELGSASHKKDSEIPKQVRDDKRRVIDGIAFGMGEKSSEIHVGDKVDIAYIIDENEWPASPDSWASRGGNGDKKLQLKVKDIKIDEN